MHKQSHTLSECAATLHLKPNRHAAFHRLAVHHFHTAFRPKSARFGSPEHLDAATRAFLRVCGPCIWPGLEGRRGRLSIPSTVKRQAQGLIFTRDSHLRGAARKRWKDKHGDGKEPTEDEGLLGSVLGRLVRGYFAMMAESEVPGVDDDDDEEDAEDEEGAKFDVEQADAEDGEMLLQLLIEEDGKEEEGS